MSTVTFEQALAMSGLESLEAMASGDISPPTMVELLGMRLVEVDHGVAIFEMTPDARMMNLIGSVHGGVAATLLDSAMGCAVHSTLDPGEGWTTAQLNLHYLRAMQPGMGTVRAVGTVLHRGRKQATAEGKLFDTEGRLLAHGTTTCLILPARHERDRDAKRLSERAGELANPRPRVET